MRLEIDELGPIRRADVELGDLTVLVGPQATGKSIFLQFLRLVQDYRYIVKTLRRHGFDWDGNGANFLEAYLGEGMSQIARADSELRIDKQRFAIEQKINSKIRTDGSDNRTFYVPAQRVLMIASGWPTPFQGFDLSYPFVLKDFSENIRYLMDQGLGSGRFVFPQDRLKKAIRASLDKSLFRGAKLSLEKTGLKKRLVLTPANSDTTLPIMLWSTGQREFTPLLLGLYYLLPSAAISTRGKIETIIIEEPEMGLHPRAIRSIMLAVMELLNRGYKVIVSTHSYHVLELQWAIQRIQEGEPRGRIRAFMELFDLSGQSKELAEECLTKSFKTYYFKPGNRGVDTIDISSLDLSADEDEVSSWGGMTEFTDRIQDTIADLYQD